MYCSIVDGGCRITGRGDVLARVGGTLWATLLEIRHSSGQGLFLLVIAAALCFGCTEDTGLGVERRGVAHPPGDRSEAVLRICPDRCIARARADVDGDGRIDHIGFFSQSASDGETALGVRVRLAGGAIVDYLHRGLTSLDRPYWLGADDMNGDGRAEIAFIDASGAHSHYGRILAFKAGELRTVTLGGRPYELILDTSIASNAGIVCRPAQGQLVAWFARYKGGRVYDGVETTFRWSSTRLLKADARRLEYRVAPPSTDSPLELPPEIAARPLIACPGLPGLPVYESHS